MTVKVYTKRGDDGMTDIPILKERRKKYNDITSVLGDIDELNASIGVVFEKYCKDDSKEILMLIMNSLFNIGADIACGKSMFDSSATIQLEKEIDRMELELPDLKNFILPAFCAEIHLARAICRRAERNCLNLIDENEDLGYNRYILIYLNRLSDYFFVYSRYIAKINNKEEILWSKL